MTINKESLRPAFERWYERFRGEPPGPTDSEGAYVHPAPDADWLAWCGAFESLGEPVGWFYKDTGKDERDFEYVHMADSQEQANVFAPHEVAPLYRLPEVKP